MKRIISFIPARGGSVSIPKKNVKNFCGKPLIYWNVNELNKCGQIEEIWIATESVEIAEISQSFGIDKVRIFNRSLKNAQNHSTTESVMLEFLKKVPLDDNTVFILSQVTNPFTMSSHYQEGINLILSGEYNSVLSVVRKKSFYWNENGAAINYDFKKRPRRQDFKGILQENGAFYISTVGNIIKYKNRLTEKIGFVEMPEYSAIELDEEDDWPLAAYYMNKYNLSGIKKEIKIVISDVDGVLTDGGMYYSENGDELKKFNTKDGMGFELLRNKGIKTAIITSEKTKIVERRAKKLQVDYFSQGLKNDDKLSMIKEICREENIDLSNVAYIGDDVNCLIALTNTGLAACPSDAVNKIREIPGIIILSKKGGHGVVRELIENYILKKC